MDRLETADTKRLCKAFLFYGRAAVTVKITNFTKRLPEISLESI